MEPEERKMMRGVATKTSKKGGKPHPALMAEEEAQRREVVKEKLREKLELEKRALKVVEGLLEDNVPEDFLVDCAKFITPANYRDAVEERCLAKLCGYPLCSNKLGKIPTQRYKISTKTNRVYDITERKCFCSNICYKASKEFELQISKTPLWLRQHESPPEVKLLKKGDRGSFGEEVMLSERSLREVDIENPQALLEDLPSSQEMSSGGDRSDDSEQEFVSSVVSQQQRPRVHWGNMPKPSDENKQGELRRKLKRGGFKTERSRETGNSKEEEEPDEEDERTKPAAEKLDTLDTHPSVHDDKDLSEDQGVKEARDRVKECSLSETVTPTSSLSEHTSLHTPPQSTDTETPAETKHGCHNAASSNQPGLSITQVGVSRRGAAGLRDLLRNHAGKPEPDSVPHSLLTYLRRTLKEWCTEETLKFLYGDDHSLASTFSGEEVEQELDEDDLEEEDNVMMAEQKRPSAPVPDCKTLRKETEQLELRVHEFYKGRWIQPEEEEEENRTEVEVLDQTWKDPVLPLIDFKAQTLIQTKITLEKLSISLRDIVGPLGLSMTDICTELNNLVRTFRLTNTNIIHQTPEWILLSVVLLHLLSEVSPVVLEALDTSASVECLNTLMAELGLQNQDLHSLVQMFRPPSHVSTCTSLP
uniref:RNA polymerase II subunit B1 CTD phosphatase RPAP2 homolog n=1 Tax=Iconisemion striatum TaxID=60296 RepID=A0A1A7WV64_9TELE